MNSLDEFREALKINKHRLDEELVRHPALVFDICRAAGRASAERDRLYSEQKTVKSARYKELKESAIEQSGRASDTAILEQVESDSERVAARKKYHRAAEQAEELLALKEAILAKGHALRELARLYADQYYAPDSFRPTTDPAAASRRVEMAEARKKRGTGRVPIRRDADAS